MNERQSRLWEAYVDALVRFQLSPASIKAEAAVIAAYGEFCRAFCPESADRLITDFCKRVAACVPRKRAA